MLGLMKLFNTISDELYNLRFDELSEGQRWNVIDLTSKLFEKKILKLSILFDEILG